MRVAMGVMDDVRDFLRTKGYEMVRGHFCGESTGGFVAEKFAASAMQHNKILSVVVQRHGEPESARVRFLEVPLREGLPICWGDGGI
jgi:hypothetical protein